MENDTEKAILERLLRKVLKLEPDFYGDRTLRINWKNGNICSVCEVKGIDSVDLRRLK